MKIHHLNCGTFKPLGTQRLLHAKSLVTHCLLIETAKGLVLVDAGFGTQDVKNSTTRLGGNKLILKPQLLIEETALQQIKTLGFHAKDVRHILLTHMDLDHIGGISDFPEAQIHIFKTEFQNANKEHSRLSFHNQRYRPIQWSHEPKWEFHEVKGEKWNGLQAVKQLSGLPPEILLIPLPGHTHGHCGVAVDTEKGWVLHAGDAYFSSQEIEKNFGPLAIEMYETLLSDDNNLRLQNLERLRQIAKDPNLKVEVFCSHDLSEFNRLCNC